MQGPLYKSVKVPVWVLIIMLILDIIGIMALFG